MVGRKVACPQCARPFRCAEDASEEPSSSVEVAPPNPDLFPPGASPPRPADPAPRTPPARAKRPAFPARPGRSAAGPSEQGPSDTEPPATEGSRKAPPVSEPPHQKGAAQTARFIQRDVNETKVTLGEDGQLPDLALKVQEKRDDADAQSSSSNSWVLIAVLCFSVLMSVAILLIDEPGAVGRSDKAEAHQQLEQIFSSWDRTKGGPVAAEMHDLLARALQAHNRGDNEQELELYRRLMDLLNREDAPRYGGFSGEDERLQELLSDLLR